MGIKDVKLRKGMARDTINAIMDNENIEIEFIDDKYGGYSCSHKWKCNCGEIFNRSWDTIKYKNGVRCTRCIKGIKESYEDIKDVVLELKSSKEEVNRIIGDWIELVDDKYNRIDHNHNWQCKCGEIINRTWGSIKRNGAIKCDKCLYNLTDNPEKVSDIRLVKDMDNKTVNSLVSEWITFMDDNYLGNNKVHKWECKKCGEVFNRKWSTIKSKDSILCKKCSRGSILSKGMLKDEINRVLKKENINLTFNEDCFMSNSSNYKWICSCGNEFIRTWSIFNKTKAFICPECRERNIEDKYRYEVERDRNYKYIKSFRKHDILPDGRVVGDQPYIQVQHNFCKSVYEISATSFINEKKRCGKCCGDVENSFAYYVNNVFNIDINDIWDYEKNTKNPYHINYSSHKKVWIKCTNKNTPYHGSYEIAVHNFIKSKKNGNEGCSYCHSKKIHLKDSFGYNYFGYIMFWSEENKISPFKIARRGDGKYKFICPNCFKEFKMSTNHMINRENNNCTLCSMSIGEKRIRIFLENLNINYIYEKTYEDLLGIGGKELSYDFYIPSNSILIEYQGEFHDGTAWQQTEEGLKNQK
nr:zinc-ribbon domain-containing protein [Clostridioides sp.]